MSIAQKLEALTLHDPDDNEVRLGDAWKDRTVVLAFIRHFG